MPRTPSLLTGRNNAPLNADEIRRATNVFMGLDPLAVVRFDPDRNTIFHVARDPQTNEEYGEIIFGPDIYPGTNMVDPNSSLHLEAAAAHELTHLYRWRNRQTIDDELLEHLDEALTSLQAIANFTQLGALQVRQLAADAMQRLRLHQAQLGRDRP
jgi:hypothetical protein